MVYLSSAYQDIAKYIDINFKNGVLNMKKVSNEKQKQVTGGSQLWRQKGLGAD